MTKLNYVTITGAADLAGVTEGAIRFAIKRGELALVPTFCGLARLLNLDDVELWMNAERVPGRRKKPA